MDVPLIDSGDEYKCEVCQCVFEANRPHIEALGEFLESDFFIPGDNVCVICDDCYIKIKNKHEEQTK